MYKYIKMYTNIGLSKNNYNFNQKWFKMQPRYTLNYNL